MHVFCKVEKNYIDTILQKYMFVDGTKIYTPKQIQDKYIYHRKNWHIFWASKKSYATPSYLFNKPRRLKTKKNLLATPN